jgi:hypothetical protein
MDNREGVKFATDSRAVAVAATESLPDDGVPPLIAEALKAVAPA